VCAVLSGVCATTVDNSGVYVYYLKGIVSVCLDARLGLGVSLEHAFTCVSSTNQAERRSSATHLLAGWEHDFAASWSASALQADCYRPLGGADPLTSDNTPSSDPKPDPF